MTFELSPWAVNDNYDITTYSKVSINNNLTINSTNSVSINTTGSGTIDIGGTVNSTKINIGAGSTGIIDIGNGNTTALNLVSSGSINTTGYMYGAVNGLYPGIYPAMQYYRLNTSYVGGNVNTAQKFLGVGVTLVANTVYEFEGTFALSNTSVGASHTFSILFGGGAVINNIGYTINTSISNDSYINNTGGTIGLPITNIFAQTNSSVQLSSNSINANVYIIITIKGTVSISTFDTFIPQYILSAAPGGAYTTQIGSYIKISPLSASGANTSIGSWA